MDSVALLLGGAAGAGLSAFLGRNREDRTRPTALADELNWAFLVDDGVVLQKDGALLAGFRYRGPDVGSATLEELQALAVHLNDALLPFTDGWMFHVDAIRSPASAYPASLFPRVVPAWIDAERRAAFANARPQFTSEFVLCATYVPPRELYGRSASFFVRGANREIEWETILRAFREVLLTLEQRLGSRLHIARLGSDDLTGHLHRCLTGLAHPVHAPAAGAYLNSILASQELIGGFAPRIGELSLRIVSITAYPASAGVGALDFLNALPFAYRWSSRFIPVGQHVAASLIKRQQRKWFMNRRGLGTFVREATTKDQQNSEWKQRQQEELFYDRDATDMARDAAGAQAENSAGSVRFGFLTQTIVVAMRDADEAFVQARATRNALQDRGFTARIETVNAMDAFFGSLPGHGSPNLRRPLVNSANVTSLWPVTSVWAGLSRIPSQYFAPNSPPLMHVETDGSTPFRMSLHVSDVGHTLVVGATGGGKSTLVGLLVAQWQRYPAAKVFVFDVGGSHWLLAAASGAQHYDIGVGAERGSKRRVASDVSVPGVEERSVALQPLADVDLLEERIWAAEWLESLLELQGLTLTPARRLRIERALTLVGAQPREFRTLTELTVQLQDREMVDALRPYTIGGMFGTVLDASTDTVAAGEYQVFELKRLLDMDDRMLVPVLLYLFRRIERQLDGSPTLIVIEELWAPLMRTVFSTRIKQWLLTLRKQNAAVVLVAHSLAQLDEVPAKQVIIESCPTKILLPNAQARSSANATLYRDLGLNEREIALIAEATPKRDYYVKSPLGSRLITLDLGPTALAFLTTPEGYTVDTLRPRIQSLASTEGDDWPRAWLDQHDVQPRDCQRDERVAEEPSAGEGKNSSTHARIPRTQMEA